MKKVKNRLYSGIICSIGVLLLLMCPHSYAVSGTAVKVALVADKAFDLHESALVSLLEVELSQKDDIQLLERAQIRQVLGEQELSLTGLLQRNRTIQIGQLLRVDAFVLLSIEDSAQEKQNQKRLLRVRVTETAHGLRLLDTFEELDSAKLKEIVERITEKVIATVPKITLPPGEAIPVGIVDIHRVQLGERYQWLARTLPAMLSVRLGKEPRIIMLEREDLKILHDEKLLAEGEDTEFWGSAVLVGGYLQGEGNEELKLYLRLIRSDGFRITAFDVTVDPDKPTEAIEEAAGTIIPKLLNVETKVSWEPNEEAKEFFSQGQLLKNHKRHKEALTLLETAHALQPDCVFYTGAVFGNEWEARTLKKGSFYSDLELAEFVSLLVRRIQREHGKGLLSKSYVLQECGKPLGLATNRRGRLTGYFSKSASVSTDEIRQINRENRRIWTGTIEKAGGRWIVTPGVSAADVALISSDEPEEVIENVRQTVAKFIMPLEMGGEARGIGNRFDCAHDFLMRPGIDIKVEAIEKTHLKGKGEKFKKLWLQYLEYLTKVDDPVVRCVANLVLVERYRRGNTDKAKRCCSRALEILQSEIENLNEPCRDGPKREMRSDMSNAIMRCGFDPDEIIRMFEEIYNPLIEKGDARNLALWSPGIHYRWGFYRSNIAVARKSNQLLERIATVLETCKDSDNEVAMSLNRVKDTLATIRDKYHQLLSSNKRAPFPVRILLNKEDWPHSANNFQYVRVFLQGDVLWLAFAEPGVGLVGINLGEKKLTSLWQADSRRGMAVYDPAMGRKISGSITGIAVGEDLSYVSIRDIGLVEFPGSLTKGQEFLEPPKILTEKDGLPSVSVTGMTSVGSKLWVAYGGAGKESGLIIYDPKTCDYQTVLCSTLKGDPPFNSGRPYEISSLTLGPKGNLFFIVGASGRTCWRNTRQIAGLWKIDINSKELKFLWHDEWRRYFLESIEDAGESWWLSSLESLCQFDPHSEVATFIFGESWKLRQTDPMPELKRDVFVPGSPVAVEFGHLGWGHISLRTAAVHGDRLWARLGKSQLIILHKGKGFQEAEIIENNILNGDKVLRFFSTLYGLVAIGEGTVALIETRSNL